MNRTVLFRIGLLGVILFIISSTIGGLYIENYNPLSQFISETYAIDTQYGKYLRFLGYIPSGLLLTVFAFTSIKLFPKSRLIKIGFMGIGLFYGIATIIVGFFPCDKGCNKEFLDPTLSQLIHNLTGFLTYVFVPISIFLIAIGLRQVKSTSSLVTIGMGCGTISLLFSFILFSAPTSSLAGLYQRIVELAFITWIVACAYYIKKA
ncbi:MAG: hypothetical protein DCF13_06475 [Flavobacteriaceae bacterium]|nr:MAG: hypothetical protein DCF13_06475 [Flavobacteriaceae bacterium]